MSSINDDLTDQFKGQGINVFIGSITCVTSSYPRLPNLCAEAVVDCVAKPRMFNVHA